MLSLKSENALINKMFVENINSNCEFQYYSKFNRLYLLECIEDKEQPNKYLFSFPIKNRPYNYTTTLFGKENAKKYIDDIIQNYICV